MVSFKSFPWIQLILDRNPPDHICSAPLLTDTLGPPEGHTKTGDVAQLGERGVRNAEVRGSIPLISTKTSSKEVR